MQSTVKRRLSFTNNNNNIHNHNHVGKSPRVVKKTHVNTPLKPTYTQLNSSPFTPGSTSDSLFQSVPNRYNDDTSLLSSPPMAVTSSALGGKTARIDNFIVNTPMRLTLSVGSDGKATINKLSNHGSQPLDTPTKNNTQVDKVQKGKNEILSLLKKMRNNNSNSVHSSASKRSSSASASASVSATPRNILTATPRNTLTATPRNILPSSPPMMAVPQTPGSITFNQFIRTGLTPKIHSNSENTVLLDQILLEADTNTKDSNNKENIPLKPVLVPSDITSPGTQNNGQFPFKYSVGDPLLINDDVQWTEIINKSNTQSNQNKYIQSINSTTTAATSPTNNHNNSKSNTQTKKFISFGGPLIKEPKTPRAQLDTLLAATHSVNLQDPMNDGTVSTSNLMNPNNLHHDHHRQNSLQFTPLIQQTMTGSFSSKFSPRISLSPEKSMNLNSIISTDSSISNNGEIDASTALKSLITGAE